MSRCLAEQPSAMPLCAQQSGHSGPHDWETVADSGMTGDPDMDSILFRCFDVLRLKGRDYTIGSKDRMANFNRASDFFGVRPEQALGIYLHKHVSAIYNYILSGGQSESEPIRERIVDCVNYMLLLAHMISKKPSV